MFSFIFFKDLVEEKSQRALRRYKIFQVALKTVHPIVAKL